MGIIAGFRKTVEFFDLADKLFGQSEEDLVFRKLVGIEELFAKDYAKEYSSLANFIEETCANPNSEGAFADFVSISAKLNDIQFPELDTTDSDEKVQNSTNVEGYPRYSRKFKRLEMC